MSRMVLRLAKPPRRIARRRCGWRNCIFDFRITGFGSRNEVFGNRDRGFGGGNRAGDGPGHDGTFGLKTVGGRAKERATNPPMQDEFSNRLDMFTRCLDVLDLAEFKPVWENQPPVILTTKVGEARVMVGELQTAQQQQEAGTSGATGEKEREAQELEDAASLLAMGQSMGARLASWEDPTALRMHQFVGAVRGR